MLEFEVMANKSFREFSILIWALDQPFEP
jgi:hypothetical protein